jgi:hypothetical protein
MEHMVKIFFKSIRSFLRLTIGTGNKGTKELKRLECSINYNIKSESASREKG